MRWRPSGAAGARFQSRRPAPSTPSTCWPAGYEDFKRADRGAQQPEIDGGGRAQRAGADDRFERALGEDQGGEGRFRRAFVPGNTDLLGSPEKGGQPRGAVRFGRGERRARAST